MTSGHRPANNSKFKALPLEAVKASFGQGKITKQSTSNLEICRAFPEIEFLAERRDYVINAAD